MEKKIFEKKTDSLFLKSHFKEKRNKKILIFRYVFFVVVVFMSVLLTK